MNFQRGFETSVDLKVHNGLLCTANPEARRQLTKMHKIRPASALINHGHDEFASCDTAVTKVPK